MRLFLHPRIYDTHCLETKLKNQVFVFLLSFTFCYLTLMISFLGIKYLSGSSNMPLCHLRKSVEMKTDSSAYLKLC